MRLELTGRHVDITPALRRLVDAQARQARTAAERQRRLGAGRADPREAPPPRRHHAARPRREVPARRRRVGGVGDVAQPGGRQDRAAGAARSRASGRSGSGASVKGAPLVGGGRAEAAVVRPGRAARRGAARAAMPRILRASRQALKPMSVADAAREIDAERRRRASSSATPRRRRSACSTGAPNGELDAGRDRSVSRRRRSQPAHVRLRSTSDMSQPGVTVGALLGSRPEAFGLPLELLAGADGPRPRSSPARTSRRPASRSPAFTST